MDRRRIGTLEVSVVGLGCNNFGGRLDAAATARVVDAALDAGINFLDTADIYGGTLSEEYLGQALQGRRERVVLATKFGMKVDEQRQGAKPAYVRAALDDSLKRLRTDRIDLYQLHQPDPSVPIADTLGALNEAVRAGKVREIGCSNFSALQLREAAAAVPAGAARERPAHRQVPPRPGSARRCSHPTRRPLRQPAFICEPRSGRGADRILRGPPPYDPRGRDLLAPLPPPSRLGDRRRDLARAGALQRQSRGLAADAGRTRRDRRDLAPLTC
jgi:hypothetical protein